MLYSLVLQILRLPEYLHRDAMRKAIAEWSAKRPLVREVQDGQTTFEATVLPIVKLNTKEALKRKDFPFEEYKKIASEMAWRCDSILPLSDLSFAHMGRGGGMWCGSDLKELPERGTLLGNLGQGH